MTYHQSALAQLSELLPLEESELRQILEYAESLPEPEATTHLKGLLGDSPAAEKFVESFKSHRSGLQGRESKQDSFAKQAPPVDKNESKKPSEAKGSSNDQQSRNASRLNGQQPSYAAPAYPPPRANGSGTHTFRNHTNPVIEAAKVRARDEQEMQQLLQNLQFQYQIYNSEIEPEHDTDYPCSCPIHRYKYRKWNRYGVQEMWSRAVMYPGEKSYNDRYNTMFNGNPYAFRVVSPYGRYQTAWGPQRPIPHYHARSIHQTIELNNSLNAQAQTAIDAKEPKLNIWEDKELDSSLSNLSLNDKKRSSVVTESPNNNDEADPRSTKSSGFMRKLGIKSSEERAVAKTEKKIKENNLLRDAILQEEQGRWPDGPWRSIVENYQEKVGMKTKIADLRNRHPIQYLHLLRAGYFEPIPVAWANQASNPLKFTIESSAGWRGLTPAWRGYEDTAEERLYWVLNHREGSVGMRMKPDFISEMNMARARMATAVEPPPLYFSADDTCHVQHTSAGYSKQVMPPPFRPYDRPEVPTDDTMILLDVSGSMDFDPVRPIYEQYLITGYARSTQPKNKDVAKAIIRRFTDAMANHDHQTRGYDLTAFSSQASYIGTINHRNLDSMWRRIHVGGGTRVMTGWQKVKEMHFQKHSESARLHPVYGWQAGPETPMLRLLLLLDGEATDMDEFELDLLGLSWAHVTIFLIGVDGCPHHHRHANELQRISDVNHHVSFVDAQGNTPERFVTHELLKRHLGYDISMQEFETLEELPPYTE